MIKWNARYISVVSVTFSESMSENFRLCTEIFQVVHETLSGGTPESLLWNACYIGVVCVKFLVLTEQFQVVHKKLSVVILWEYFRFCVGRFQVVLRIYSDGTRNVFRYHMWCFCFVRRKLSGAQEEFSDDINAAFRWLK